MKSTVFYVSVLVLILCFGAASSVNAQQIYKVGDKVEFECNDCFGHLPCYIAAPAIRFGPARPSFAMWIVLFALRYKYTIGVLAILILLFGVMSGRRMSDIQPKLESETWVTPSSRSFLNSAMQAYYRALLIGAPVSSVKTTTGRSTTLTEGVVGTARLAEESGRIDDRMYRSDRLTVSNI